MKRLYGLDLLKIFATTLILIHHYQQIIADMYGGDVLRNTYIDLSYMVELFFIISGYLAYRYVELIYKGLKFKDFYFKRFLRFFPMLSICVLVMTIFAYLYYILYGHFYYGIDTYSLWNILVSCLGIQEGWGIENPQINNPTWFISYLMLCYVLFYFLTYLAKRLKIPYIYLFIAVVFLGISKLSYGFNIEIPFINGRGYTCFFWGILIHEYLANKKSNVLFYISMLVSFIIPWMIYSNNYFVRNDVRFICIFILFPALIVVFTSEQLSKIIKSGIIGRLGQISFDVYIWHAPLFLIMFVIFKMFNLEFNMISLKAMVVFICICWFIGTLSYYIIERPVERFTKNKFNLIN